MAVWSQSNFKHNPSLTITHLAGLFNPQHFFLYKYILGASISKFKIEETSATRWACMIGTLCLFEISPSSTGSVLGVFRRFSEGGAVPVDSGEQHRSRGAAQTVAVHQSTDIWERLETHHTSPLRAGGLVRRSLTRVTAWRAVTIPSMPRVWTVQRHHSGGLTLARLRAAQSTNLPTHTHI